MDSFISKALMVNVTTYMWLGQRELSCVSWLYTRFLWLYCHLQAKMTIRLLSSVCTKDNHRGQWCFLSSGDGVRESFLKVQNWKSGWSQLGLICFDPPVRNISYSYAVRNRMTGVKLLTHRKTKIHRAVLVFANITFYWICGLDLCS